MNDLPLEELVTNSTHLFPDCSHWIFDMLNDPLLLLDEFGMILFMNDKARNFYGHSLEEAKQLHIAQLDLKITVSAKYLQTIRKYGEAGYVFLSIHKKKNNELVPIQIHARYIKVHNKSIFALMIKDISVEKQLKQEFERISQIQREMLPAKYKSPLIEIRSIYRPYNYVSGDFFDFKWENNHILHGYIFDIMGHGLATAFNMSAIRVLLTQAFEQNVPLNKKLDWFNQQAISFIEADSFVAVLVFSFDFNTKQLTYSMAGINQFLAVSQKQPMVIQKPGIFVGLDKNAVYEQHTMSFFSGDIFYFMTDGLFELLPDPAKCCPNSCTASYRWLNKAMHSPARRDDISALCLYIK